MTTNGVALAKVAQALADAGLKRINISLDTLDWERFKRLTFRDRYDDVIEGIAAARAAGLSLGEWLSQLIAESTVSPAGQLPSASRDEAAGPPRGDRPRLR